MNENLLFHWFDQFPLKKDDKMDWHEFFMAIAFVVSRKSTCLRAKCGAVIVRDERTIISTGYNGAPSGQKDCIELKDCFRNRKKITNGTNLELCRAVGCHSESNAITLSALNGSSTKDCDMYVYGNNYICNQCKGMIKNAGIRYVYYVAEFIDKNNSDRIQKIDVKKKWDIHPIDIIEYGIS
jgi:dCMP deaminase